MTAADLRLVWLGSRLRANGWQCGSLPVLERPVDGGDGEAGSSPALLNRSDPDGIDRCRHGLPLRVQVHGLPLLVEVEVEVGQYGECLWYRQLLQPLPGSIDLEGACTSFPGATGVSPTFTSS